ncbi:MAG: hypothetical protein ACOC6I_03475, partial [Candidatus Bipolaricaulota bacterium]
VSRSIFNREEKSNLQPEKIVNLVGAINSLKVDFPAILGVTYSKSLLFLTTCVLQKRDSQPSRKSECPN